MMISVIVPTLNEERYITNLFNSLAKQDYRDFEVIVVDGGSRDRTVEIAQGYGARVLSLPGVKEFASRNEAAKVAAGDILLHTGADVIFPKHVLGRIALEFSDHDLLAVAAAVTVFDGSFSWRFLFALYNFVRWVFAKLPKPFKRFSSSTNFLALRKEAFEKLGGFALEEVNADGLFGRKVCRAGKVRFFLRYVHAYQSARRIKEMGGLRFTIHFLYVMENFFNFVGRLWFVRRVKYRSAATHSDMRKKH